MDAVPARLRRATVDDAPAFAAIAVEALAAKYRPALGGAALRGATALTAHGIGAGGASRHIVAEVDGRIAGVVHLALGPGGDHAGLTDALGRAVGRPRALRAAMVFGLLGSRRIAADTGAVEELAVAPWARRRGIGRALLRACAEEALSAGRTRLSLMVTADNAPALALYAAEGFVAVRRRRWPLARWVFHAPGALIMECRLTPR